MQPINKTASLSFDSGNLQAYTKLLVNRRNCSNKFNNS